ncbi:phosphonoacetate hydrolase [Lophiotrema nucula]|uniref:Phosphonoacetate hydrolase n=1 Tax=Lophiotrema nucula TaxID=690887 RepID=A0A6A5ZW37_9PLEO|nr:phosphonoacetate hydrolase [Lophiotrema nucula]
MATLSPISLHDRTYALPKRPTIVICVDGFDPEYLEQGVADGILPTLTNFTKNGFNVTAECAMPSVTNANNVSIITGVPTAVHGINGNYYIDEKTGEEKMVLDDELLRGSTILAEMVKRGVRVAAITAKDKLRRILQHGLNKENSICFSAQDASDETLKWLGRDKRPEQYSGDLSLFVLDAGLKILQEGRADLYYLTLSDFIQHKNAPGSPEANEFMAAIDARVKAMIDLGAVVALTGDHGMSDKSDADSKPNVLFVQDELEKKFGPDCARVICPITDPFVKHHGALGGFVRVHVNGSRSKVIPDMIEHIANFPQVEVALAKEEACDLLEMPFDREGDFIVVSKENSVVGSKESEHDLSTLGGHKLRSHGGFSEQKIPLIMSEPAEIVMAMRSKRWRNFDIFDLILNYGQ